MAADPPNPHDALVRKMLDNPADAASEIRAASPEEVVECLDWQAFERVDGTMVPADLHSRYSDLIFRTRTRTDGRAAVVYVLLEHQSNPDPLMAFRMLEYVVGLIRKYLPECKEPGKIPAVFPYVLHTGPRGLIWDAPLEVGELFDLDESSRKSVSNYLPRMRYILDDVNAIDVPTLLRRPLTAIARVTLMLVKVAPGNLDMSAELDALKPDFRAIRAVEGGEEILRSFMTYVLCARKIDPDDVDSFGDCLEPEVKEILVTTAEMLEARGEARGRVEGRAELLLQLLEAKFGHVSAATEQAVLSAERDQLDAWAKRFITARSIDEVLI